MCPETFAARVGSDLAPHHVCAGDSNIAYNDARHETMLALGYDVRLLGPALDLPTGSKSIALHAAVGVLYTDCILACMCCAGQLVDRHGAQGFAQCLRPLCARRKLHLDGCIFIYLEDPGRFPLVAISCGVNTKENISCEECVVCLVLTKLLQAAGLSDVCMSAVQPI